MSTQPATAAQPQPIHRPAAPINRTAATINRTAALCAAVLLLGLSGCKTTDEINAPIVDMPNPTYQQRQDYVDDLNECSQYADEVQTGKKVGMGAATGAAIGGAVGAIFGGGSGAAEGAGSGAVVGGAQGGFQGAEERSRVIKTCLRGRGYKVLN